MQRIAWESTGVLTSSRLSPQTCRPPIRAGRHTNLEPPFSAVSLIESGSGDPIALRPRAPLPSHSRRFARRAAAARSGRGLNTILDRGRQCRIEFQVLSKGGCTGMSSRRGQQRKHASFVRASSINPAFAEKASSSELVADGAMIGRQCALRREEQHQGIKRVTFAVFHRLLSDPRAHEEAALFESGDYCLAALTPSLCGHLSPVDSTPRCLRLALGKPCDDRRRGLEIPVPAGVNMRLIRTPHRPAQVHPPS